MPGSDKLSIIVDVCLLLGQQVPNQDDGSNEWNVCSAAYEKGLRRLLEEHDWKFGKFVEGVVGRTDPDDPAWQDAYARPANCLHIIRVLDESGEALDDWKILGDKILVNKDDGISVEFIADVVPDKWPGMFVDAQMHFVMAGAYRGLNKDPVSARIEEAKGEALIKQARPRTDMEEPGKAKFVSSLVAARRIRRG